ncbi:hypothetical protein [Acinetobacter pittii]|uniref:hypothetical protein n=1 Tax=Acinetobacter pittii TaxID=48296 RepID=UPI00197EA0F9|nr:hypothetical protein [Acinetobacter pittii]MBN6525314.1 hypothetical protein [Acinetobacter pittii]
MGISNNDLEAHKIAANIQKWTIIKDILFLLIKMGAVVWCIYLIMTNLVALSDRNAESISSIAKVVESLSLSDIVLYIVTASGVTYGYLERRGKKRAIAKMAQYQYQLEQDDPFRGTSNLTSQGDSPKPTKKRVKK